MSKSDNFVALLKNMRQGIWYDVLKERDRQTEKHGGEQWYPSVTDPFVKNAILVEELGEVSKELWESKGKETPHLREELVQVCAVCVAWIESIDGGDESD